MCGDLSDHPNISAPDLLLGASVPRASAVKWLRLAQKNPFPAMYSFFSQEKTVCDALSKPGTK